MGQQWYASISDDLDEVESLIYTTLKSSRPELDEMCKYVISSGGKRIRPAICVLSHHAAGGTRNKDVLRVAAAFEIIHAATLIHDDINDCGEIRRGRKTLHKEYSTSKAIIVGDYMFAMGFNLVGSASSEIVDTMVAASAAMAESEFIQKNFEHRAYVSEEDYMEIIRGKTAMPIYAAASAGTFLADVDPKLSKVISDFALDLGLAFQIIDDILDVAGDSKVTGKRVGLDVLEGKPTLPIIYGMADPIHGKKIRSMFEKKDISEDDIDEVLTLIKKTNAIDRCRNKATEILTNSCDNLSVVPDSEYKNSMIALAKFTISRDR